jgi:hypothetical protein
LGIEDLRQKERERDRGNGKEILENIILNILEWISNGTVERLHLQALG